MNASLQSISKVIIFLFASLNFNNLFAQNTWVDWNDESAAWLSGVSNNGHEKDIAVGDLNNDGLTDIVVVHKAPFSNPGAMPDLLLLNNGTTLEDQTAAFASEFISNPSDARDVYIGDLDNDGWADVVLANTFEDQPIFYHNLGDDGNGNWLGLADESAARFPQPMNVSPLQFCALWFGDLDDNGGLDIYFSNYGQNQGQGGVEDVLLMNDGNGFFTDETDARLGDLQNSAFGTSVEIHDMDDDGDLDIVKISTLYNVAPWNARGVFLLFNDGSGNFNNWQNLTPGAAPYMLTIDDFDENGLMDLYVVDDNPDYFLTAVSANPDVSVSYATQISPDPRTVFFGGNCKLSDIDKDGDLDVGIAGVDVDIPPCEIAGIRQFTMDRNDGGSFSAPYGPVNYPWNVSAYDFAFINLDDDCFPDLFMGLCNGFKVFINQSEIEAIEISGETIICGNGSTTLTAPSGYDSYFWSNGSNNQSITVNQENNYCVTVSNEHGCTTTDCINVIELNELNVNIAGNPTLCFGETETLTADSGFATYEWSTQENTQNIIISNEGMYCVTVSDDNGCTGTECISIEEIPALSVSISGVTEFCFGQTETLSADDGFSNYLWSNNETTQAISVSNSGDFCVTVTDENGCTAENCISVEELSELSVSISGTTEFCFGQTETLSADAGFSSYLWSNNETTQNISVANSGDFCVTVTDENGCTAENCISVEEFPALSVSISGNTTFCFGDAETLTADDGFSNYLWSNNETTQNVSVENSGDFCVTVTDENGCTAEDCISVTANESTEANVSEIICFGEVLELGGQTFDTSGDYEIELQNANEAGCDSTIFLNLTVLDQAILNLDLGICFGESVEIEGEIFDESGDYEINLPNASAEGCDSTIFLNLTVHDLAASNLEELICFGDSLEIEGETFDESGDYEILLPVVSINGCDSFLLLNLTVNPEIILINSQITDDDGSGSGMIEIEPDGGTPPYLANWSNGQSGGSISNLPFGEYSVVITDSKGCEATFTFTVDLETAVENKLKNVKTVTVTPNPFAKITHLSYELTAFSNVRIDILNPNGQIVDNLFYGNQLPGAYSFEWDATNFPTGVYFLKIEIDGAALVKKLVLSK